MVGVRKTVYKGEKYAVHEMCRDYDFTAVIENLTDRDIVLHLDPVVAEENAIENNILVPARDWVGLFNFQYEGNIKQALEQGDYMAINAENFDG